VHRIPSDFRVEVHRDGPLVRVAVAGEIDMATAPRVREAVDGADLDHASQLALDLGSVTFMDSTGLRLVIGLDALAHERGRRFVLMHAPPHVLRLLEVSGLRDRFVHEGGGVASDRDGAA
jgi:anti-anti-sigma factor